MFHSSVSKLPQSIYLELKGVLCPSRYNVHEYCPTAVLRFKQKVLKLPQVLFVETKSQAFHG